MSNQLLIFDFSADSGTGKSVMAVLSKSDFHIHLLKGSFEDYTNSDCSSKLNGIIKHYDPDLLFFVLPPSNSEQSNLSFQSVFIGNLSLPVIVVLERGEADQMPFTEGRR